MTNQELTRLLRTKGYKRVTLETDSGEPKTYYTYRRGLHINATKDLFPHRAPIAKFGIGTVCRMRNQRRGKFPDRNGLSRTVFPASAAIPARGNKRGRDNK